MYLVVGEVDVAPLGIFRLPAARPIAVTQLYLALRTSRTRPHPRMAHLTSESIQLWFTLGKHSDDIISTGESDTILSLFTPDTCTSCKFPDPLPILSIVMQKSQLCFMSHPC